MKKKMYFWRMQSKWYIGFLIILFTGFGVVCKQQAIVPNQEVILQFNEEEVSSQESQTLIAIIKEQLQAIGVNDIVIHKAKNQLKIIYYSEVEVDEVRLLLSQDRLVELNLALNPSEELPHIPFEKEDLAYNLNVYELLSLSDVASSFSAYISSETKSETTRVFYFKNISCFLDDFSAEMQSNSINKPHNLYEGLVIAINKTSQIIPEVRAGPALI